MYQINPFIIRHILKINDIKVISHRFFKIPHNATDNINAKTLIIIGKSIVFNISIILSKFILRKVVLFY